MQKSNFKDIEIRYVFTEEERNALGPKIARLSQDKQEKEDEKKEAVQGFNAEIKAIEKTFNENVNRLNNGWEMRIVPARSYKNYATSEWEYYSVENYDLLKTEPFGPYDFQMDVDDEVPTQPQFTGLTDEVPAAEGTEQTNPTLFTILLRELNYWRDQLKEVESLDDQDSQIDVGLQIQDKISRIENALRAMEVKPDDPESETSDEGEIDDSWEQERKPDPTLEEVQRAQDEEPDEDTKRGLNQIAKDLGDDPIFPDNLPENPTPKAEHPVDPTAEDDGRPKRKRNGVGKITFRGKDGEPLK